MYMCVWGRGGGGGDSVFACVSVLKCVYAALHGVRTLFACILHVRMYIRL